MTQTTPPDAGVVARMRRAVRRLRPRRETLRDDAVAGLVLGVQSVPDGLALGLLAGVNPLAGLYGYVVGTIAGALATSSVFMVVQGTGAMAMVIADVPAVHEASDPARALFTLSVLTGIAMLAAGLLRLGTVLRFVSRAVMVGFINAVGVNIVLGQLSNLTGYSADGPNRVVRAVNTLISPTKLHWTSIGIGLATIALIILLERTRMGALGLVVAVIATSGAAVVFDWPGVATLNDLGISVDGLPGPVWPSLAAVPVLIVPALSLMFVALVQGAGISSNFANPDGTYPDASRDFVGQGVANVASGLLQGMPVGGSVSATALNKAAGARSRQAPIIAGLVMVVVILVFGDAIGYVAMPALAGLLMLIGIRTVKPADLKSVWRTGTVQKAVLSVTFALTMLIPLQYAVVVGVGLSVVLYVIQQSNAATIRRWRFEDDGQVIETAPPSELSASQVVVLQPYGSLFFATAPVLEAALPAVGPDTRNAVVILRLRGHADLGTTFLDALRRYAEALRDADSKLVVVSAGARVRRQLEVAGITDVIGAANVYGGDERVGATVRKAYEDAVGWVASREAGSGAP